MISQLFKQEFQTKLGDMLAITNNDSLLLLSFTDAPLLAHKINKLTKNGSVSIMNSKNHILIQLIKEVDNYFSGSLTKFTIPIELSGTVFQNRVWKNLLQINYGTTQSYLDVAQNIDKPKSFRAVAQANAANNLLLVVPCHRVINNNGAISGYSANIDRKKYLLKLECDSKRSA